MDRDKTVRSSMQGVQEAWSEGDERTGESRLLLWVPRIIPGQSADLTYGEFVEALIGFNQVRLDYPMLQIDTSIKKEGGQEGGLELGRLSFYTGDPEVN